ncbi:tetratricopeptide repeat protein [Azospirillum sp. SYSU D00513]|uniref:tetratricopeptide repeat protein n=1 Tax=Azospirillum sp. SYSU D00513 TaxID=2812561 RepID=UPI001A972EC7|nr:tetratricopeptide repeat protein [Azospirillum sp. SYSU D00513]
MDNTLQGAMRLHQAGRHAEAEPIYRTILDREPENRDALQLLALLMVNTGRPEQAAGLFRQILRLDPGAVPMLANLAAALRLAGKEEEADGCLRRALALDPSRTDSWFTLANSAGKRNLAAPAARGYRRALALNPAHGGAAANLAALLRDWGPRLNKAARLKETGRLPGTDLDTLAEGALALDAVGEPMAAEETARRALGLDSGSPAMNALLGRLLLDRSGIAGVKPGKPFAVDKALAVEAVAALGRAATAAPGDDEAERLQVAAVATLVQAGMADEQVLREGARAAWRRLRRHPKDTVAASVVGYHIYRSGRLRLASRLNRLFQARFTAQEVAREHELGIWAMLRADEAFFRSLPTAAEVTEGMVPLEIVMEPAPDAVADSTEPAILISCDDVYCRRFAPSLLESVAKRMPGATVIVHVVTPFAETGELLARWGRDPRLRLCHSRERPDTAGWPDIKRISYYAAGRFIRAYQWQQRLKRPLIVLDTDATVTADLREFRTDMDGYDVGLLIDPRRRGPSREVTVCFNYYNSTDGGVRFFSLLVAYIGHFLRQPNVYWLLDQTAPYAVLDWMSRHDPIRVRAYDFLNFPYCRFVGAK